MAGKINQNSIEAVFDNVMSDEVEKMSEEDRRDAMRFHLEEAVRFGAEERSEGHDYIPSRTDEDIDGMNGEERAIMQEYYLRESERYGAESFFTSCDEEEEEDEEEIRSTPVPAPRHRPTPVPAPRQRPTPVPAPRQRPVPAPRQRPEVEDDDEERRHFQEKSDRECESLRECVKDIRAENAQTEERNSINLELVAHWKRRNVLMREESRITMEMEEAEEEWNEITLRKEDI